MNIFVLCTGRCGSVTFTRACEHLDNYSSGHESKYNYFIPWRLQFPDNHIEADLRLAWYLGPLEDMYGQDAFYVHLTRDPALVAQSYTNKFYAKGKGQSRAWWEIVARPIDGFVEDAMRDMVSVVTLNIRAFLKDKEHMVMDISEGAEKFPEFCSRIDATGDMDAARAEFSIRHNAMAA